MIHEVKCDEQYFEEVWCGRKAFEVRFNDRNYQKGDLLILREYKSSKATYCDRIIIVEITYMLKEFEGLQHDYVVMGISIIAKTHNQWRGYNG